MIEDMYNKPRTAKPVHTGETKLSQGHKFNVLIHEGKEIQIPAANYIKEMEKAGRSRNMETDYYNDYRVRAGESHWYESIDEKKMKAIMLDPDDADVEIEVSFVWDVN